VEDITRETLRPLNPDLNFRVAAICRRGHIASTGIVPGVVVARRCETCGAVVLLDCPACHTPIRGNPVGIATFYTPPDFCFACGQAFPWASRQAVVYALQNLLDEQPNLSEGDRRHIDEELSSLLEPPIDAKVGTRQQRAMETLRRLAPRVWDKAWPVAATLLTAEARAKLGLPP
jgi:hypothetical protein